MDIKEIKKITFFSQDLNREITIKDFFIELLKTLWIEEECFSGKRPWGNSGWKYDVEKALVENKIVWGIIDEEGYVEDINGLESDKIILNVMRGLK